MSIKICYTFYTFKERIMKKKIEHLKKDLIKYDFSLCEKVFTKKDCSLIIQGLEGLIAKVNILLNECENREDVTTLLQIEQTAEIYRERAKGLQEVYCTKKKEEDNLCNNHPRFKTRDDASAGYFEF